MKTSTPRITLVGAGPGDPELITIKGVKALQQADVVLYDALVNPEILDYVPEHVTRVFVGKRGGKASMAQEEINELLVALAQKYGHAVRLKGGDPFVFGRGYEEIEYAVAQQIPVAVVPGLSSATSVPAMQQVPVTHRGLSESFWVVTGTTRTGEISGDIHLAAQSTATVVILMGMHRLQEIMDAFAKHGKGDEYAMIIQNGATANEKVAVGRVQTIVQMAAEKGLGSPAIIVVGKVVGLHHLATQTSVSENAPQPLPVASWLWPLAAGERRKRA